MKRHVLFDINMRTCYLDSTKSTALKTLNQHYYFHALKLLKIRGGKSSLPQVTSCFRSHLGQILEVFEKPTLAYLFQQRFYVTGHRLHLHEQKHHIFSRLFFTSTETDIESAKPPRCDNWHYETGKCEDDRSFKCKDLVSRTNKFKWSMFFTSRDAVFEVDRITRVNEILELGQGNGRIEELEKTRPGLPNKRNCT